MFACTYCSSPTENPKFCSKSCAAKENNRRFPKRKLQGKCRSCGKTIHTIDRWCSSKCKEQWTENKRREAAERRPAMNTVRVAAWRQRLKVKAIEYKGGSCARCGYNKCVRAMHFHHVDPTQKDFAISSGGKTRAWERVKAELDKCILLCANCHAEEHERLNIRE